MGTNDLESTLEMVTRRRHLVRCLIRGGVVILCAWTAFLFILELLDKIPYAWGTLMDRPIYSFRAQLVWAGGVAVIGPLLWRMQNWIARVVVPIPRHECPKCGYTLQHLTTKRCPECGTMFGSSGDSPPPTSSAG